MSAVWQAYIKREFGIQEVTLRLLEGPYEGEIVVAQNFVTAVFVLLLLFTCRAKGRRLSRGMFSQKRDRQPWGQLPAETGDFSGASELFRVRPSISDHGNGPEKGF
jgi:hypothetical protein